MRQSVLVYLFEFILLDITWVETGANSTEFSPQNLIRRECVINKLFQTWLGCRENCRFEYAFIFSKLLQFLMFQILIVLRKQSISIL